MPITSQTAPYSPILPSAFPTASAARAVEAGAHRRRARGCRGAGASGAEYGSAMASDAERLRGRLPGALRFQKLCAHLKLRENLASG